MFCVSLVIFFMTTRCWRAYPLVPALPARIVLLGKVPQIVIVVEVEKLHKVLEGKKRQGR